MRPPAASAHPAPPGTAPAAFVVGIQYQFHMLLRRRLCFCFVRVRKSENTVRQMAPDELTFTLFDATRGWTATIRKSIANWPRSREFATEIAASVIADRFKRCGFYASGETDPMSRQHLIALWRSTLEGWSTEFRQRLVFDMPGAMERARYDAAISFIDALNHIQVLTDAPDPPPFRIAAFDGGSGVPAIHE